MTQGNRAPSWKVVIGFVVVVCFAMGFFAVIG